MYVGQLSTCPPKGLTMYHTSLARDRRRHSFAGTLNAVVERLGELPIAKSLAVGCRILLAERRPERARHFPVPVALPSGRTRQLTGCPIFPGDSEISAAIYRLWWRAVNSAEPAKAPEARACPAKHNSGKTAGVGDRLVKSIPISRA